MIPIRGLTAKRVYAWADILQMPRDAFFRFVMGESDRMGTTRHAADTGEQLTTSEAELRAPYRRRLPKYQRRLREHGREYLLVGAKEALSARGSVEKPR